MIETVIIWAVNAATVGIVGVWVYALLRSVKRAQILTFGEEKKPKLERIPETHVLTVRSSWLEAHFIKVVALIVISSPSMLLVRFQVLGLAFLAPPIVALISIALIWLHCHLGRLVLTDKRVILHGGMFADPPIAIRLPKISRIEVKKGSRVDRKLNLYTIEIESDDPTVKDVSLRKVHDATRFEAILLMLRKKAELGLPIYAPLPADVAREWLKAWRP